ncbi:hypothetical protein [Legionella jordanis]|uniref:hypothetical protein n=1 Tax=Legionella jordanis TaxID=456 RepID=UPI00138EFB97|nr:hypothetical protein [Legionella jordanis]
MFDINGADPCIFNKLARSRYRKLRHLLNHRKQIKRTNYEAVSPRTCISEIHLCQSVVNLSTTPTLLTHHTHGN